MMNTKLLDKLKWIALGVLVLVLFATCLYDDLITTYTHSLHFLDCIFSGKFFGFYEYTLEREIFDLPADYYIIIYIIFGIWNFPIWILKQIFSIDSYSVMALLWAKMILLPFIAGVFQVVYKMLDLLGEKDKEHTFFMMGSSLLFVLPICFIGQYDIISLFFVLWGILQCMKDERLSWKAILLFAVAVPIKVLAIFPVMLIILVQEKRIIEVVKKLLGTLVFLALCVLPYSGNTSFHIATQNNGGWFAKLSNAVLSSGWNGISIFWLTFFGLCIVAYKMEQKNLKEYFKQITWILTAFYSFFFIFVEAHPQWSVLLVPFIALLIREENRDFKLNLLLETIAGGALVISQAYYFHWVYFTDRTSWLLLKNITEKASKYWIVSLRDIGMLEKIIPLVNAVFFAAVIGILVLNHPWKEKDKIEKTQEIYKDIFLTKMKIDWLRILCIFGYIVVTFLITYVL